MRWKGNYPLKRYPPQNPVGSTKPPGKITSRTTRYQLKVYTPSILIIITPSMRKNSHHQFYLQWDNYGKILTRKRIVTNKMTRLLTKRKKEMSIFVLCNKIIYLLSPTGWSKIQKYLLYHGSEYKCLNIDSII